ncbi:MAG: hypothetical protein K2K55_01255 [Duncaniella sp.]|nr:hypothetical protein [Duncaniella sp.]
MPTNKRYLKKEIRLICGAVAEECLRAATIIPGIDVDKLEDIVVKIAETQEKTLRLISVAFPRSEKSFPSRHDYNKASREYYKASFAKLKSEFNQRIQEILKEMNDLLTPEAREANKIAAQSR